MLVGFIGAPCSGKTTTAAKLFAELKDNGQPSEYVAEKARSYIAAKKFTLRAAGNEHLFSLSDEDQISIAKTQYRAELTMNHGNIIVVTDSCVLNSLLYMTPSAREGQDVQRLAVEAASKYDIVFVCGPVPRPAGDDPNRVHDEATSMGIHSQIEPLLLPFLDESKVHYLSGPSHARLQEAISVTLNRFAGEG